MRHLTVTCYGELRLGRGSETFVYKNVSVSVRRETVRHVSVSVKKNQKKACKSKKACTSARYCI